MEAYLLDWANLLLRWFHVIVAIAWIGSSFYFVFLDNNLLAPTADDLKKKGVDGAMWAVHGGGFYNPQKYMVAPQGGIIDIFNTFAGGGLSRMSLIALGVILTWSGRFGINIYNTGWIIFVAYIARYMAFSLKSNSAALEQVHDSLVEASRASGATPWQSLRDVVIPLIRPGMIAAFFLIFLPALRELTTSVLLYGPTTRTIGVAIYTLNEDGETVYACALAGVALLLIVGGEILIKRFFERKKRVDNGGA